MSDSLRDRIAAVVHQKLSPPCCDECHDWGPEPWEIEVADAVIRELGMRRESMLDGIAPVDDPPAWHHRYTTDWIADE